MFSFILFLYLSNDLSVFHITYLYDMIGGKANLNKVRYLVSSLVSWLVS